MLVDGNNKRSGYGDGQPLRQVVYVSRQSEVTFDIADGKTLVIGNTENDGLLTLLLVPG